MFVNFPRLSSYCKLFIVVVIIWFAPLDSPLRRRAPSRRRTGSRPPCTAAAPRRPRLSNQTTHGLEISRSPPDPDRLWWPCYGSIFLSMLALGCKHSHEAALMNLLTQCSKWLIYVVNTFTSTSITKPVRQKGIAEVFRRESLWSLALNLKFLRSREVD